MSLRPSRNSNWSSRLLQVLGLLYVASLSVVPAPAHAETPPRFVPTIHVGDERFLFSSSFKEIVDPDTVCIYGGPGSLEGRFQDAVGVIPDWQGWIGVDRSAIAGNYADVFPRITDLDPSKENLTPVVGFIDSPAPPGGSSSSPIWTYGIFGGYVVNYTGGLSGGSTGIWNEVWSPEILWDFPGTIDDPADFSGCLLEFDVWRHLPFENGIFYTWAVRSSDDNGLTWSPFRDYNEAYFGTGLGDWFRHRVDVSPLLVSSPTNVQIALGVFDVADSLGLPGIDATPSPVFDNVALCKFRVAGSTITLRDADNFQDAFPTRPGTSLATQASRDSFDVRIDMARDINPGQGVVFGDSLVAGVRTTIPGAQLTDVRLFWLLEINPLFEQAIRSAPSRPVDQNVIISPALWTGEVLGDSSRTAAGVVIPNLYFFDLPDIDFMYPGDVFRYYIQATDNQGRISTLPRDITGFATGARPWPAKFTMRALPSYSSALPKDAAGVHPTLLVIQDGTVNGRPLSDVYEVALDNLGLIVGTDYDLYRVNAPESCLGNGIGAETTSDITPPDLEGFTAIIYDSGDLECCLLSDGSGDECNDEAPDIAKIQAWHDMPGNRFIAYFGDNIASWTSRTSAASFVSDFMGVTPVSFSVTGSIENQTAPVSRPVDPTFALQYVAYGGTPILNQFDEITGANPAAAPAHQFTSVRDGTTLPVASSILWDREKFATDGSPDGRNIDMTFPYSLASVWSPMNRLPAQQDARKNHHAPTEASLLLEEILAYFGLSPGARTGGPPQRPVPMELSIHPNPANPRSVITLTVGVLSEVSLAIYDLRGRRVRTLFDGPVTSGQHRFHWKGEDDAGARVASGVYLVRATGPVEEVSRKIALVR